jgi:hypothetical protein
MIRRYLAAVPLLGLGGDWLLSLRFQNQKLEPRLRDARPRTCPVRISDVQTDGREVDSSHATRKLENDTSLNISTSVHLQIVIGGAT